MTKRQQFTENTPVGKGRSRDSIGGQSVMFRVDAGANVVRPTTKLEEWDAMMDAMRRLPVGQRRTCALPGCREHWTQGVQRGRQRIFCTGVHREAARARRERIAKAELKSRPARDLIV